MVSALFHKQKLLFAGGALRKYLEGIRDALNVQNYVENNPIGEPSITSASPLWSYVEQIRERVNEMAVEVGEEVFHSMQYERPNEKLRDKRKRPLSIPFQEHNIIPSEAVELEYTTEASTDNPNLTGKIHKRCGRVIRVMHVLLMLIDLQILRNHFSTMGYMLSPENPSVVVMLSPEEPYKMIFNPEE